MKREINGNVTCIFYKGCKTAGFLLLHFLTIPALGLGGRVLCVEIWQMEAGGRHQAS